MIEAELHYDVTKDAWYYVIPYGGTRYVSARTYRLLWTAKRAAKRVSRRIKRHGVDQVRHIDV